MDLELSQLLSIGAALIDDALGDDEVCRRPVSPWSVKRCVAAATVMLVRFTRSRSARVVRSRSWSTIAQVDRIIARIAVQPINIQPFRRRQQLHRENGEEIAVGLRRDNGDGVSKAELISPSVGLSDSPRAARKVWAAALSAALAVELLARVPRAALAKPINSELL